MAKVKVCDWCGRKEGWQDDIRVSMEKLKIRTAIKRRRDCQTFYYKKFELCNICREYLQEVVTDISKKVANGKAADRG